MDKLTNLMKRLESRPDLLERVESILDIVDNKYGDMELGDEVEERVIQEMKGLGQNVLEEWANGQSVKKTQQFAISKKGRKDSKKK